MIIEFLKDGSADCPLVRIYGTDPQQFSSLVDAITGAWFGNYFLRRTPMTEEEWIAKFVTPE